MSALTTAALTVETSLRTQAMAGDPVSTLFRNDEVFSEFPIVPFTGGATINIKMHYAGNDSVRTFDEGDADGVAGTQSYLTAYWPEKHYDVQVAVTGHAVDYTLNGNAGAVFFDQIKAEVPRAIQDMVHRMSTDMLSTGTTAPVGIQGIIDSAGTVASINRSTYTWFGSYEAAGAATTVSFTDLDEATYQNRDTTYDGRVNEIWTSWYQGMKYKGSAGNPGTTASPVVVMTNGGPGAVTVNPGSVEDTQYYGTSPIKKKHNLTNSIWLGLTKPDFFIGRIRDWKVDPLPRTGDTDRLRISYGCGLGCKSPKRSWKKTGFTA